MTKQQILDEVLQIIARIAKIDVTGVTMDTSLVGSLNLTSLEILVILTEVEDTFGISVPETEYKTIVTAGDYAGLILRYKNDRH